VKVVCFQFVLTVVKKWDLVLAVQRKKKKGGVNGLCSVLCFKQV